MKAMDYYTTRHVMEMFDISHTTVQKWTAEFGVYLSPTAKPEAGRKRLFTDNDVRVFALVNEYREHGHRWEDAHVALQSGQRGDVPIADNLMQSEAPPALIQTLKDEIMRTREQVELLKSERDETRGQNKLLAKLLEDKERQIQELYEKLAELKALIKH